MSAARIFRPLTSDKPNRVAVLMPFHKDNRGWLKSVMGEKTRPTWNKGRGAWEIARTHFPAVATALAERYGTVTVTTDHALTELCTAQCQGANPENWITCECVCGGYGHGKPNGGKAVGDGTLIVYSDRKRRRFVLNADATVVDLSGDAPD